MRGLLLLISTILLFGASSALRLRGRVAAFQHPSSVLASRFSVSSRAFSVEKTRGGCMRESLAPRQLEWRFLVSRRTARCCRLASIEFHSMYVLKDA